MATELPGSLLACSQGAESSQGATQATRALSERGGSLLNTLAGLETTADPEAAKEAELERECIEAGVEYIPPGGGGRYPVYAVELHPHKAKQKAARGARDKRRRALRAAIKSALARRAAAEEQAVAEQLALPAPAAQPPVSVAQPELPAKRHRPSPPAAAVASAVATALVDTLDAAAADATSPSAASALAAAPDADTAAVDAAVGAPGDAGARAAARRCGQPVRSTARPSPQTRQRL